MLPADPWPLLERLFPKGLSAAKLAVPLDEGGEVVTADSLESALAVLNCDDQAEAIKIKSTMDPKSLKASMMIALTTDERAEEIALQASRGNKRAQAFYKALVLKELIQKRDGTRRLVNALLEGSQKAQGFYANIRRDALAGQPRARVALFLILDAKRDAERRGAELEMEEKKAEKEAKTPHAGGAVLADGGAIEEKGKVGAQVLGNVMSAPVAEEAVIPPGGVGYASGIAECCKLLPKFGVTVSQQDLEKWAMANPKWTFISPLQFSAIYAEHGAGITYAATKIRELQAAQAADPA